MNTDNAGTDRLAATPRSDGAEHAALLTSVASKLADLSNDAEPVELATADAGQGTEVIAEDAADGTTAVVVDDDAVAGTDQQTDDSEAADDGSPTLPAAIVRSLKAYQWTNDEIEEAFTRDPEGFLTTASKIHASRIQETQGWAALGRAQRDEDSSLMPDAGQKAEPDPAVAFPDGGIAPIDFDQLAEASGYDKDALIKAFGPLATTIEAINKILPTLNDSVDYAEQHRQTEQATLARQIDDFFQSDDLKPYQEFYGESWDSASNDQVGQRNKALTLADHMIVGAAQHGQIISTADALELAHHTVAAEVKTSVVRKELAKQVTQRRKGISIKPTSKTTAADTSGSVDRDQLIANTRQRLDAVFTR